MASKDSNGLTRREFLKTSGAAAALVGVGLGAAGSAAKADEAATKTVPPSEKIVLGFIGVGGRGSGHLDWFGHHPDVEIGAICDVYDEHLRAAIAKTGGKAKGYSDFRKLLENKDIDGVVIATPPHWHPLVSIMACQAGKDVYCEKPMSRFPGEARLMLKAAQENKRITQVGTQIHSMDNYRRAVEIVKSGMLGKIAAVRVVCTMNEYPGGIGHPADTAPPSGLDWDMWLGPAPKVPFNKARFEGGQHRYFRDYVGSWLGELGPHIVDLAQWAMEPGEPLAASASGGRYVADDISDIPDTMNVLWEYPGFTMSWMHTCCNSFNFDFGGPPDGGRRLGVMFHGNKGTLLADYGSHQIIAEGERLKGVDIPAPSIPSSPGQEREFLDSIKSRKQPPCSFEYHTPLAVALNIGQIALDSGRKVTWDAEAGKVVGDSVAERFARPNYRKPWRL